MNELFKKVGWIALIDMCCDPLGRNAVAPFFYSAFSDATLQADQIAGLDVVCNPVFYDPAPFIETLKAAHKKDSRTRALLIVPDRDSHAWFKDLKKSKLFRVVSYYGTEDAIFTYTTD